MAASVNGWRVLTRKECTDIQVPGGAIPVHPEFAWLFWDLANSWHETVEHLVWPGCWGWAEPRPIRGGTVMTNHASGTAVDLCAPLHPRGVPVKRTFTAAQLEAVSRLEARYFGVLRWGGRWTGDEVDGMHWEGIPGVAVEAVENLTRILRDGGPAPAPPPPPPPAPAPAPPGPGWSGPDLTGSALALRGDAGANGPRVRALQAWLGRTFPAYRHALGGTVIAADGWWGDQTCAWLREFGRRSSVPSADGRNIGPQLSRRLYLAGFRG